MTCGAFNAELETLRVCVCRETQREKKIESEREKKMCWPATEKLPAFVHFLLKSLNVLAEGLHGDYLFSFNFRIFRFVFHNLFSQSLKKHGENFQCCSTHFTIEGTYKNETRLGFCNCKHCSKNRQMNFSEIPISGTIFIYSFLNFKVYPPESVYCPNSTTKLFNSRRCFAGF